MHVHYCINVMLFIILFLHQTTTISLTFLFTYMLFIILFLHQTTTRDGRYYHDCPLFIILFLHQTTTRKEKRMAEKCCLSSCSYIKPQLISFPAFKLNRCLSSCSYIKPQPIVVNLLVISKILRFGLLRNGRAGRFLLQIY